MSEYREMFKRYLGHTSPEPRALEFHSAQGVFLITESGQKYLDLVSGYSVSNLGHCHPKIVEAVKNQAEKYMHQTVYGEYIQAPQVLLAQKLAQHLPAKLQCTYFVSSGSEAIETAMKLAKRYNQRKEIIYFQNAYHGSTQGAMSILGNENMKNAFLPLLPDCKELIFNNFNDLSKISNQTACVVIEPIQAEAGIVIPNQKYLSALRQKCDETGSLLIFDEIQTGFGRSGKLFAFEHFQVIPDILCLAKALGGGMPLGAVISSSELLNLFTFSPVLGHITTFGGHPVCAAAGLASLEVLFKEEIMDAVPEKTNIFVNFLDDNKYIKEIRHLGLLMAIEFHSEEICEKIRMNLLERNIIAESFLFSPASLRIAPPLTINKNECIWAANEINSAINTINHANL